MYLKIIKTITTDRRVSAMKTVTQLLALCLCCALLPAGALAAPDVLFEASVALQDGAAPTQFSVTKSDADAEDWPDDPILQIAVTPPDAPGYTLVFPSQESAEFAIAPLLHFTDMNGDGSLDIAALYVMGASNVFYTYFLYDPADQRLHYASQLGILANAAYDADHNVILSQVSDGVMLQYYTLFGFADGQPAALGTAYMEEEETEQGSTLHTNVTAQSGEVLLDTVLSCGDHATVWNAQYEAMMQVLLDLNRQ